MSLAPGVRVGAYEILSLLGRGGMGEVYRAHDTRLRRDVALKVLPSIRPADPERLRRFEQEARAAAALNHPNILSVYDIGQHDGFPYIVMELVPGETLAARIRRGPVPLAEALRIGADLADALGAAHAHGIVHRDLKPGNVMCDADGRLKILDFGLAKMMTSDTDPTTLTPATTRVGQVLGTPGYMSPEQLLGRPLDHRTDIFSLGVILFELVTGQRPFAGDDVSALRHTALTARVRTPADVDPSVPRSVSALVARMMERDPAGRPDSAGALAAELRQLRSGVASTGASTEAPRAGGRAKTRESMLFLGVALAIAISLVVAARWPRPPATGTRPVIAVLPLADLSADQSASYIGTGIADSLTTNLSQLASISVVSRATLDETGARQETDVARIARELAATLLVQGSVQRAGDRLRVNVRLVRPDGSILWSGESEAATEDLVGLEGRIAASLLEALRVSTSDTERLRLARPPTTSREALDAYWRGTALLERSDDASLDGAIASFKRAVAIDPGFALAHGGLAYAYTRRSRLTNDVELMAQALEQANDAVRLQPDLIDARMSLVYVYRWTGRNGAAVDELRRILARQPSNDDAHRELGEVLASEGRYDDALDELGRADALRPQYWRTEQSLGMLYMNAGRFTDAIEAFTRLVHLQPDDASHYQQLGVAYLAAGDTEHGRQNLERSISISPDPGAYANLGNIFYEAGQFDEAAHAYEEAARLDPTLAVIRRNLGDAYLKLGRPADAKAAFDEAVRLAQEALAVNPSDATLMSRLAVYEAKVGRRREAEQHAMGALTINPASPDIRYRHAVVLALAGDADRAMEQLSQAIAAGYPPSRAEGDDDLAILRGRPGFPPSPPARKSGG